MNRPWWPLVLAVAQRPRLWTTALVQAWRIAPRGWWHRWPPSPMPPAPYVDFRLQTVYGTTDGVLQPADLVAYLEWCRRMRGLSG